LYNPLYTSNLFLHKFTFEGLSSCSHDWSDPPWIFLPKQLRNRCVKGLRAPPTQVG
jgi:hypothetical protein